jgi:hypothetical protein
MTRVKCDVTGKTFKIPDDQTTPVKITCDGTHQHLITSIPRKD